MHTNLNKVHCHSNEIFIALSAIIKYDTKLCGAQILKMTQSSANKTKASETDDNKQKRDSIGLMNFDKLISGELKSNQLRRKMDGRGVSVVDNKKFSRQKCKL